MRFCFLLFCSMLLLLVIAVAAAAAAAGRSSSSSSSNSKSSSSSNSSSSSGSSNGHGVEETNFRHCDASTPSSALSYARRGAPHLRMAQTSLLAQLWLPHTVHLQSPGFHVAPGHARKWHCARYSLFQFLHKGHCQSPGLHWYLDPTTSGSLLLLPPLLLAILASRFSMATCSRLLPWAAALGGAAPGGGMLGGQATFSTSPRHLDASTSLAGRSTAFG